MNRLLGSAFAVGAAFALAACAQQHPTMEHSMMMGHMPMMMGGSQTPSADMGTMMAACMEHMQATAGSHLNGDNRPGGR